MFLQFYTDKNNYPQVTFVQVKEKFGTLTIYHDGANDFMRGAIQMVEHLSATVCEDCGVEGKQRRDSWVRVTCDACEAQRGKD